MKKKMFVKGLVEKSEDGILHVSVASSESMDRDGEIIAADGWQVENFLKNPVLLWAHDYRQAPIGKVIELVKDGSRLLFKAQFAVGISKFADEMFQMYQQGFLNAFSVGFIPKEWKDAKDESGNVVRTFTKAELLEISAVPVPANPTALVLARSAGFDSDTLDTIERQAKELPMIEGEVELKEMLGAVLSEVQALRKEVNETKDPAGLNSTGAASGESPAIKVASIDEVEFSKRLLQTIDKAVGEALRQMKARAGQR